MNHLMDESQYSGICLSYFVLNVCPVLKLNLGIFSTLWLPKSQFTLNGLRL